MSNDGPVLNAKTQQMECGGCGKKEPIKLPIPLQDLGALLMAFARDHGDCAEKYSPKGGC